MIIYYHQLEKDSLLILILDKKIYQISIIPQSNQEINSLKISKSNKIGSSSSFEKDCYVWDLKKLEKPFNIFVHQTKINSLDWCQWDSTILCTGNEDSTIKFWDINKNKLKSSIETKSPVYSVMFNRNNKEIISTHGGELNEINKWNYKDLKLNSTSTNAHQSRILYSCQNFNGSKLLTSSHDEVIKIWRFKKIKVKNKESKLDLMIR